MDTNGAVDTICTLEPISILFSQYDLTVQHFAEISGMDYDMASNLSVTCTKLRDGGALIKRNPLYDLISDEQYKRINDFFLVNLTPINEKGEFKISLSANPEVESKLRSL